MVFKLRAAGFALALAGVWILSRLPPLLRTFESPDLTADQRLVAILAVALISAVGLGLSLVGSLTLLGPTRRLAAVTGVVIVLILCMLGRLATSPLLPETPPPLNADGAIREGPMQPSELISLFADLAWLFVAMLGAWSVIRWLGRQPGSAFVSP